MEKKEVLGLLEKMFKGCGDVRILCMNNSNNEIDFRWRICRDSDLGSRMNWSKCKKILINKGISFIEGEDGYGWVIGRCIDFNWNS